MSMAGGIPDSDRDNNHNSGKINIYTCTVLITFMSYQLRYPLDFYFIDCKPAR